MLRRSSRSCWRVRLYLAAAGPQQPQEPAPGRIRVTVDVMAVDVQVIDRAGKPVPDLGPEKFTVTINGRRRKVVSAEQIRSEGGRRRQSRPAARRPRRAA